MRYNIFLSNNSIQQESGFDDIRHAVARNCHHSLSMKQMFLAVIILIFALQPAAVVAHGGVVMEEDQCVIDIGLFRAHFTIYQPQTSASEEFCEDVPDLGETLFVMDYLHESLRQMPVDFRIIEDVNDRGKYASWEDVESIEDIDAVTLYYQAAQTEPGGSLSTKYHFTEKGWYVGVVTTRQTGSDKLYRAVFGFHVGGQDIGYWPWLVLIALFVQIQYWISSGGWKRWRSKYAHAETRQKESDL